MAPEPSSAESAWGSPSGPLPTEAEFLADVFHRPRRRFAVRLAGLVAFALALAVCALHARGIAAFFHGEADIRGRRVYQPPFGVDSAALRRIDFRAVHARLMPAWLIAVQRASRDPGRRARADAERALTALQAEIHADRNLDALVTEIHGLILGGIDAHADRLRYLFWAWDRYLGAAGVPFRLEVDVQTTAARAEVLFRAYRVLHELRVRVGEEPYRARLMVRVDGTNLRELYLGHASDASDGALVVLDRVTDFALQDVWPLFAEPDALRPDAIDRAHAAAVRNEARGFLSPMAYDTLVRSGAARASLVDTVASVNARRACGSRLEIVAPPWFGINPGDLHALREMAARWAERECPPVLPEEAESLAMDSARLAAIPGIPDALAELTAYLARAVTAHEVRHAADDRATDGMREPLSCANCPGWLRSVGRTELSAYLSAIATPGVGFVSYYQACKATRDDVGPHVDAVALLSARLGAECTNAPPVDLYARASALDREYFGRGGGVGLPGDFPRILRVTE